jgi:PAS domain S-box-containing protein
MSQDTSTPADRYELHRLHTPLGIIDWDLEFRVLSWNPAAERIFGYPAAAAIGRHASFIVPAEARPQVDAVWDELVSGRGGRRSTNRNVTADGRLIECEWYNTPLADGSGRVIGAVSVVHDVSAHARAEAALRASERRFAQAFYDNPALMSITRLSDHKYLDVNDRWVRVVGVAREQAVGRTAQEIGFRHRHNAAELYRRLCADKSVRDIEFTADLPDGRVMHGLASASVIDVDGEPGVLWASLDLTRRLQAEAQVHHLNAELERRVAERTAQLAVANQELESFAYSVSHDLRAPLRSIDGFSKALLEDYAHALDDEGQDYLNRVRSASQRMGDLIDDLLNLSRVSRGELRPAPVDLSELARRLIDGFRTQHPDRGVDVVLEPKVCAVGDPNLLRVVMDNLLGNAWKYTSRMANARIEFGMTERNGQRVYHVRDNGAGYDPAYADKLFKPFQRLHRPDEFEGHGIGLATVLRVVSRHGGRAWAHGQVDNGATFYFTLGTDRAGE